MKPSPVSRHLLPLLLLVFPLCATSQAYKNVNLGSSLSPLGPTSSWPSPSGDFAFGFRALESQPDSFLLAIWFNKIANKTVVWCANGKAPVGSGSRAELTADGLLMLEGNAGQVIWNATGSAGATHAAMLDSGNFVLAGSDDAVLWQSFDHPTDTILPTQSLGLGSQLYARLMDDDYSDGRFQLLLQNDGDLVFYQVALPTGFIYPYPYWSSNTADTGTRLVFNASGGVYLDQKNGTYFTFTDPQIITGNYYQRAALDPDGIFRHYAFPKEQLSDGSWYVQSTVASEICELVLGWIGSGACGFNSYCIPDGYIRSNCQCPPRYSFVDPARKYKGCKPDFPPQRCEAGADAGYEFQEMMNVDWPLNDAEQLSPMNETECRRNCLSDCFCTVAIYKGGGTCYKKRYPLSNGKMGSDIGGKALLKVSIENYSQLGSPGFMKWKRERRSWILAASLLLGGSVFLNLVQLTAWFRSENKRKLICRSSSTSVLNLRSFTYKELEEITSGFSEEVGRGAYGTVYKGVLSSEPQACVAVKKLECLMKEAEKDFTNEVSAIGQTHHKNLVRLLGFCKEGAHRLLVYEFMSNGSLNGFLFASERPGWGQRAQIALGIASGLVYMHEECRTQIIHCDIKPQNILLDDNLVAKISDFGLAKLLRIGQSRTSTGVRGTIGYFAPEWFKNIAITAKVDVYSFGVMLLEIVCGRRNLECNVRGEEKALLTDLAKECFRNGSLELLVDGEEEAVADKLRLETFVMVGILCIQEEPWLRPSMKKVVQMLEGAVAVPVPPNAYSYESEPTSPSNW